MKNILVVDDEYYIVQDIVNSVRWDQLDIAQVCTAYSMKQAQRVIETQKMDILLTDIEMPGGSGLDLIEWVHAKGQHPVIFLLTGHQRFDYAHRAIALQCAGYILKPVNNLELESAMRGICDISFVQEHISDNTWDQDETFVYRVRQLIRENLASKDLNRAFLAEELQFSEDYLSYLFHERFGQTLSSYITSSRIDKAKELLIHTSLPLEQISERTGFSNSSYFNKKFKSATEMTPRQYRNTHESVV